MPFLMELPTTQWQVLAVAPLAQSRGPIYGLNPFSLSRPHMTPRKAQIVASQPTILGYPLCPELWSPYT